MTLAQAIKLIYSDLEYAFDIYWMGPEFPSMEQSVEGMRSTAIHEGGHCLVSYLLYKRGEYDYKPRIVTIIPRIQSLGHVSEQRIDKSDSEHDSIQTMRGRLVVGLAGRAAQIIVLNETGVNAGAAGDSANALKLAKEIGIPS